VPCLQGNREDMLYPSKAPYTSSALAGIAVFDVVFRRIRCPFRGAGTPWAVAVPTVGLAGQTIHFALPILRNENIAAAKWHILKLKCAKFDFDWGSDSAPQAPYLDLRAYTSEGNGGEEVRVYRRGK